MGVGFAELRADGDTLGNTASVAAGTTITPKGKMNPQGIASLPREAGCE
jgi:hypothetical protein